MKDFPAQLQQNTSGDVVQIDDDVLYNYNILGKIFSSGNGDDESKEEQHEYSHELEVEKYFSLCRQSKTRD